MKIMRNRKWIEQWLNLEADSDAAVTYDSDVVAGDNSNVIGS
jgi:hypothetical protein